MKANSRKVAAECGTTPDYSRGKLTMPAPEKPVKGSGFARFRWRMDGELQNHDRADRHLEEIPSGLQSWFYEILPQNHKTKQGWQRWISPEAWRVFADHRDFWNVQWALLEPQRVQAVAAEKAEAEKKRKKRAVQRKVAIQRALAPAAVSAGLKTSELEAKLSRLKSFMESAESVLFAEMILAADPWLLEAVLVGASIKNDGDGHCEYDYGHFFSPNSNFRSDASDLRVLFFWLVLAEAQRKGCSLPQLKTAHVSSLYLFVFTQQQLALVNEKILPELRGVKELSLHMRHCVLSTADLPVMPQLSSLSICMDLRPRSPDQSGPGLRVQEIGKQAALRNITVKGVGGLEIDDDQIKIFERVRLEASGFERLNNTALKVLLSMHTDYSDREPKPMWWSPHRFSPDVAARVAGKFENFSYPPHQNPDTFELIILDRSGKKHGHEVTRFHLRSYLGTAQVGDWVVPGDILAEQASRSLELSASLTAEQLALIAESGVPVRLHVKKITEDFRELSKLPSNNLQFCICAYDFSGVAGCSLANFTGEIRIYGECDGDLLEPFLESRGVLWLEGKQFEGFNRNISRQLARFKGVKLGLVCWENLSEAFLRELAAFPGELHLVRPDLHARTRNSVLEIEHVRTLISRTAPVRLGPRFQLSATAVQLLRERPEVGLRHYRRVLKSDGKQLAMEQTYDSQNGYKLRKILDVPNKPPRITEKGSKKEILLSEIRQYSKDGWDEISPES